MPFNHRQLALVGAALAGMSGYSAACAQAAHGGDRRQTVGDWLIEDVADEGGRTVRLGRDVDDVHVGYEFWIPREADRIGRIADVRRFTCSHGGGETVRPDAGPAPEAGRADLIRGLEHCSVPADAQSEMLDGFVPAYAAAWAWVVEERAGAAAGTMTVGAAAQPGRGQLAP